ncbi:MAG: VWA domain-containing protein [Candidatus Woesearchaeota archaeon]
MVNTSQRVVAFDRSPTDVLEFSKAEELSGKLRSQNEEEKLMHSVVENDADTVKDGKLVSAAINQGFSGFQPDMMFEKLTKEYSMAEQLYGEKLIRLVSGYEPGYIKRNIKVPEFRKELKKNVSDRFEHLTAEGLVSRDGEITEKGFSLASIMLYVEEIERMTSKGFFGTKPSSRKSSHGDKQDVREYRKGDRYRNLAVRQSLRTAIRRGHEILRREDLRTFEKTSKGSIQIIYAIDASGSMKGEKITMAKRAGIALAYTAITNKDKVGLLVFGTEVRSAIEPTLDFMRLIRSITAVQASRQTDISKTIQKAAGLFSADRVTKHLIILTDCLPTIGKEPEKETIEAAGMARAAGITISLVGIKLDSAGKRLAEHLVKIGKGRLYIAQSIKELDMIVLRDYYSNA